MYSNDQIMAHYLNTIARQDDTGARMVGWAMCALHARQTAGERQNGTTSASNGRGFSRYDARKGTYYARWVLSGKMLSGKHLERARAMARKYRRQVCEDLAAYWESQTPKRVAFQVEPAPETRRGYGQVAINRVGARRVLTAVN